MAIESQALHVRPESARKVWIYNDYEKDHVEDFRGEKWTIPANGRIMKPVLEANKFLSQALPPSQKLPNGTYKTPPKALRIVELGNEERSALEGVSPEAQKKAVEEQNLKVALTCMKCGFLGKTSAGLKSHMTTQHPEMEPIKDDALTV